mmetsp:Transcript_26083/g.56967  ORF Transcript_26083/g.56967 Transcript_26083/m.56967 type:complete len:243 (+) Transcript_26083:171-899(+)|eukprot:CAMPEP_0202890384 /NCGR_PEP_ID=MMETSP1392-20130828/805_1 /ASSEMBLY_ACC=CAM_ASM_000868 /TAXON_ID=225041 /ORGANISM="Chlamydomonas chlamydogama, Strain SAG 11-48b" /LENGTH=242 /DNA_ID=CAMNT_0049573939 /DNA_START=151 /DNA_END=879 /DNA_ORIENTATION=+
MAVKVVAADVRDLKVAFLGGAGRMGYALARLHSKSGFKHVTIGSRDVARAKEAALKLQKEVPVKIEAADLHAAADAADVVFWVAGPTGSMCKSPADLQPRFEVLRGLRRELQGKLIVDCTNVMYAYPDSAWGSTSSLLLSQEALGVPARWTCAWKSVFFKRVLGEPAPDPDNPMSVFVCGDDKEAKDTVISMVDVIPGFKGLDAGSANHSRILELLGPKWLQELETWNYTDRGYVAGWRYGP